MKEQSKKRERNMILLGNWEGGTLNDVIREFCINSWELEDKEILIAYYENLFCVSNVYVLYKDLKDGKLYEIDRRFLSFYGPYRQWFPVETNKINVEKKLSCINFFPGDTIFKLALNKIVRELKE